MIKVDKWKVTIVGMGVEVLPEFGVLVCALVDALKKAGVPTDKAKEQLVDLVNAAFEDEPMECENSENTEEKSPLDEVEDLLGKILETLKEVHK